MKENVNLEELIIAVFFTSYSAKQHIVSTVQITPS